MSAATPKSKRRYAPRMPVEERREHLLDAALRVLARDGYDQVSIEAIANEAGVTRPVVYAAYNGLEPLLHSLLDRTERRALASAMRLMPEGDVEDVDGWLVQGAGGLIDAVTQEPDVWRPILGITQNAPPMVRERIDTSRELIRGFIADALEQGLEKRGGPFIDVEMLSHLILISAEHFGRLVLSDPEHFTRKRVLRALKGLLTALQPIPRG